MLIENADNKYLDVNFHNFAELVCCLEYLVSVNQDKVQRDWKIWS